MTLKEKLKFEYKHHLSAIVNPTPDVTEQDKKKARITSTRHSHREPRARR